MDDLLHAARDLAYEVRAIVRRGLHLPNDVIIPCERVERAAATAEHAAGALPKLLRTEHAPPPYGSCPCSDRECYCGASDSNAIVRGLAAALGVSL